MEITVSRFFFCLSDDQPLIVQFAAHDAQTLADAASVVAPFSNGIDINCGCPQRCMNTCYTLIALQYYNGSTENHHADFVIQVLIFALLLCFQMGYVGWVWRLPHQQARTGKRHGQTCQKPSGQSKLHSVNQNKVKVKKKKKKP